MSKTELTWADGKLKIERAMVERQDVLNDIMSRQNAILLRIAVALEERNKHD